MVDVKFIKENAELTGTCGDNFCYYLCEGTLYLEGSGELCYEWDLWDCGGVLWIEDTDVPRMTKLFGAQTIIIGEGCTRIDDLVFEEVSAEECVGRAGNRTVLTFEWKAETILLPESVRSIGWDSFSGCSSLTEITIPRGVKKIESGAFYFAVQLTSINLPDGLEEIESFTFCACEKLRYIRIPSGVTTIGNDAFSDCTSLESLTIPDSVTEIEMKAFANCTSLQSLTIPDSVTKIGHKAFANVPHIVYHGPAQSDDNWGAKKRN